MRFVKKDEKQGSNYRFRILAMVMYVICFIMANPVMIRAADKKADVSEVTDGINILTTLTLAVVQGAGVIYLAWGVFDFATSYSDHNTSQQNMAIKKVLSGIVAIAVPEIVKILV